MRPRTAGRGRRASQGSARPEPAASAAPARTTRPRRRRRRRACPRPRPARRLGPTTRPWRPLSHPPKPRQRVPRRTRRPCLLRPCPPSPPRLQRRACACRTFRSPSAAVSAPSRADGLCSPGASAAESWAPPGSAGGTTTSLAAAVSSGSWALVWRARRAWRLPAASRKDTSGKLRCPVTCTSLWPARQLRVVRRGALPRWIPGALRVAEGRAAGVARHRPAEANS